MSSWLRRKVPHVYRYLFHAGDYREGAVVPPKHGPRVLQVGTGGTLATYTDGRQEVLAYWHWSTLAIRFI